jgi:hypothetical protein
MQTKTLRPLSGRLQGLRDPNPHSRIRVWRVER